MQNDGIEDKGEFGVSLDELTAAMADVGSNWERVPLRHSEGREGWEDAMLGCLKDVRFPPLAMTFTKQLNVFFPSMPPCQIFLIFVKF